MRQSDIDRFWLHVDRSGDCWLWSGVLNNKGYGYIDLWVGGRRKRYLTHRFAYQIVHGVTLTREQKLLHSCDTPRCVNPDHLSIGTQLANMRDALSKGRMDMTGLTAGVEHNCRECGAAFNGPPNRRYCDEHRYTSAKASRRWREQRKRGAA